MRGDGERDGLFTIDLDRLDQEWQDQADLFHTHALRLARARRSLEEAKAKLKVVESEVKAEVRKDPGAFGLTRATDEAVKEAAVLDPRVREAVLEWINAQFRSEVEEAGYWAMDHRKRALENAVQLRLSDYYSTPKVGRVVQGGPEVFNRKGRHTNQEGGE